MKWYELALLGGAAYLFITKGGSATDQGSFSGGGWGDSTSPPPPPSTPADKPKVTLSALNVPGTTIPMSTGFAARVAEIPASVISTVKTADLGKITVTQPARDAQGLTAWDRRIMANFAAQGKAYPYK